jgi:LacI family transcriptional regulator
MNIVEFARLLNLSTGTVSRALNDRREVSPQTRQLVLEKAEEFGFRRNANARRLVTGKNFLIRLECPHITHVLSDRYVVELARAVEETAGASGYDLHLRLGTRRRDFGATDTLPADGIVLVAAPETTPEDIETITNNGRTPVVVICEPQPLDYVQASYVCLDTIPGVGEAIRKLAELGHRRIGYVGSGRPGSHVRAAIPRLLAECGLPFDPELAIEAGVTQEQGCQAAVQLLEKPDPPTAIFARTDVLAAGAIQAAYSLGLTVPGDVSVIGHDNIEVAALVNPPLTTVAIDIPQVGTAATSALLAMIDQQSPPTTQRLGTHLVVRASAGPVKQK